jgi:3-phosphoshikimate 1-carboxyvinyltransferase
LGILVLLPTYILFLDVSYFVQSQVKLSGSISSQYLSALLMAGPLALGDIEIEIIDKLISVPYVEMTMKLMERFGVSVEHSDSWDRFFIKGGQKYR